MVVALADSFFFDVDPNGARTKVLLFLVVSFAPFLLVAPFVGPVIDRVRGGRRMVVQGVALSRVVTQLLMVYFADGWVLFPLVFVALVLQKTYFVSRSALVPSVVRDDAELVPRSVCRRLRVRVGELRHRVARVTARLRDPAQDRDRAAARFYDRAQGIGICAQRLRIARFQADQRVGSRHAGIGDVPLRREVVLCAQQLVAPAAPRLVGGIAIDEVHVLEPAVDRIQRPHERAIDAPGIQAHETEARMADDLAGEIESRRIHVALQQVS